MKGMLIPTNGNPVEIDIEVDETGSTLHDLQRLVGGNIEPFDVIFGEGISLYVNEEGLFTCPPNRAVYATKGMEEAGYLSMMDYSSPVKEGELYSILCGDLVAVGFDFETGENRDLSADEMSRVADYFTEVSKPGSGIEEVIAIRMGQRREEARSEDGRVTLKGISQITCSTQAVQAVGKGRLVSLSTKRSQRQRMPMKRMATSTWDVGVFISFTMASLTGAAMFTLAGSQSVLWVYPWWSSTTCRSKTQ